jgi:hypothetical protein
MGEGGAAVSVGMGWVRHMASRAPEENALPQSKAGAVGKSMDFKALCDGWGCMIFCDPLGEVDDLVRGLRCFARCGGSKATLPAWVWWYTPGTVADETLR